MQTHTTKEKKQNIQKIKNKHYLYLSNSLGCLMTQ
jgi:hypothetical protein